MENIYDELDNFTRVAEYDELKEENIRLRKCVEEMEQKISTLTQDNEILLDKFNKLEVSFSSLLRTARAEIQRKSEMINSLNEEKNQLIFRQIGNRKNPTGFRKSNFSGTEESARRPAKRKPEYTPNFDNKIPRLEDQPSVNESTTGNNNEKNENILPASTKQETKKKVNPRAISPIYSSGDEIDTISENNVIEKNKENYEIDKEKFGRTQGNISQPNDIEQNIDKRQTSKQSSRQSRIDNIKLKKDRRNDDFLEENLETSDRLDKQISRLRHKSTDQNVDGYKYRKNSPKEFDTNSLENTRFGREHTRRLSRSDFREKANPRHSKSKGRSNSGRYCSDNRYQHSPSPDPSNSGRDLRSRFSTQHSYKFLRRRSNTREDRQRSPYRWKPERNERYGDDAKKRFDEQQSRKNKDKCNTRHDSKDKDNFEQSLNPQGNKNNKDDISNFLNRMEEEYKMHPDNINELQLDEETKDYYHNDNLILLRSQEKEKILEGDFKEVGKVNYADIIRVCQSPDLQDVGCSTVPTVCRDIQGNGSLTPMDDPRLYHQKYFDDEYIQLNKLSKLSKIKELHESITISIRNRFEDIDLKVPNYQKKQSIDQKLCDEQIKQIYTDIDKDICDISLESGELNNTFNEIEKISDKDKNEDFKAVLETKSDTNKIEATNTLFNSDEIEVHDCVDKNNKTEKNYALNEKSHAKSKTKNEEVTNKLCDKDENHSEKIDKNKRREKNYEAMINSKTKSDIKNEVTNKSNNNEKTEHYSDETDKKEKREKNITKEKINTKSGVKDKEITKTYNDEKTKNNHKLHKLKKRDKNENEMSKDKSKGKFKINEKKEGNANIYIDPLQKTEKRDNHENSKEKTKTRSVLKNTEDSLKIDNLFGDNSLITPEDLQIADAAVNNLNKEPQGEPNYFEKLIEMEGIEHKPTEDVSLKVETNSLSAERDVHAETVSQCASNENDFKNAISVSLQNSSVKTQEKEVNEITEQLNKVDNISITSVVPPVESNIQMGSETNVFNSEIDTTVIPASKNEKQNLNSVAQKNVSHCLVYKNSDSEAQTDSDCERPLFSTSTPNPKLNPEQKQSPKKQEAVSKETSANPYCNEDSLQSNSGQSQSLPQTNGLNKRLIIVRRRRVIVTKE